MSAIKEVYFLYCCWSLAIIGGIVLCIKLLSVLQPSDPKPVDERRGVEIDRFGRYVRTPEEIERCQKIGPPRVVPGYVPRTQAEIDASRARIGSQTRAERQERERRDRERLIPDQIIQNGRVVQSRDSGQDSGYAWSRDGDQNSGRSGSRHGGWSEREAGLNSRWKRDRRELYDMSPQAGPTNIKKQNLTDDDICEMAMRESEAYHLAHGGHGK